MSSNKTFNPAEWQPQIDTSFQNYTIPVSSSSSKDDIEEITQRIESASTDIAPNYADWRDLGFALSDELGENGRSYFHRLSRFYSGYTETETNKQFNNCLKAKGHGITIKTLFHLAKTAGINIAVKSPSLGGVGEALKSPTSSNFPTENLEDMDNSEEQETMPTFSQSIQNDLPDFLKQVVQKANSPEDADILLLGTITTLSSCLPNIYGIYAEREIFPNLFLFVTAQASAGKGRLTLCRKLVEPIHKALRDQNKIEYEEYQRKQTEYAASKNKQDLDKPEEPPLRTLIIPANSTATAVFQILNENKGIGLMFETEGDTLAQTFKSEHGNYSDGFRKAFHHETISYNRRKDREFVELNVPKLSTVLSGTPKQIQSLIPDAENGLFSRFVFYYMKVQLVWNDVFANADTETLDSFFARLGYRFHDLYKLLQQAQPIRFCLSQSQQSQFNTFFAAIQSQYAQVFGLDIVASVRRLGLITFRIAMILTTLRIMDDGNISQTMVCSDTDFNTSLSMVKVLLKHTAKVYQQLMTTQGNAPTEKTQIRQTFLDNLPADFDRQTYLQIAEQLNIPAKSADKYIKSYCDAGKLIHEAHGQYKLAS